jgi:hypothetical protein
MLADGGAILIVGSALMVIVAVVESAVQPLAAGIV